VCRCVNCQAGRASGAICGELGPITYLDDFVTNVWIVSSGDGPRRAGEGAVAVAVAARVISWATWLQSVPHSPWSPTLLRLLLMLLHSRPSSSSASRTRAKAVVHADSADDGGGAAAASRAAARKEGRLPTTLIGLGATSRLPSMISNSSKIAPWVWRSQASAGQPRRAVSIARRSSLAAHAAHAHERLSSSFFLHTPCQGARAGRAFRSGDSSFGTQPRDARRNAPQVISSEPRLISSHSDVRRLTQLRSVLGCSARPNTAAMSGLQTSSNR
jgi:hypothetical protein